MRLHRFAHLGDLHLGPNSRNADRRRAFDQAIAEQDQPGLSAWLWPGDINHGRMTIDDRNWLVPRVQRMANRAPVVICYGNHDLAGDLDVLRELHAVWPIYVIDRPQVLALQLATFEPYTEQQQASIFVLPYPSKAGLVAAGTPHDQINELARQALDAIFMDAAAKLVAARAAEQLTLMIGHVNVAGSITSSGQPNIGKEIEIDEQMLDRLGRIYIGLNHIHRRQEHYAGSMCRLDWGEVEEKSYTEITYGPDAIYGGYFDGDGWAFDLRYRELDVAPMYHVEGTLTTDGFDWSCDDGGYAEQAGPGFFAGAEVRVRYRFNAAERAALDEAIVRAPFKGATRLELEAIPVRTRAVRAPEVAAALTLTDKVSAFVRQSGQTWSASLETKLAALQSQPDGAAFLSDVQRDLQPRELVETS